MAGRRRFAADESVSVAAAFSGAERSQARRQCIVNVGTRSRGHVHGGGGGGVYDDAGDSDRNTRRQRRRRRRWWADGNGLYVCHDDETVTTEPMRTAVIIITIIRQSIRTDYQLRNP